jgi:hypothetical protein
MKATTSHIMMIRPVRFDFNTQTAGSNSFQDETARADAQLTQAQALAEFDNFVNVLRKEGVDVRVFDDTPEPHTPDSIFPNNWISFHEDGTVVLYPMYAPNRRLERRQDIIEKLEASFQIERVDDLSDYEQDNLFLEGTGSLILDRVHKVAYVNLSPRADAKLIHLFGQQYGYKMCIFDAFDRAGNAIYHANVVMCLGSTFAVVCFDCIPEVEKSKVKSFLNSAGKDIISISREQLENFAGNMLHIENTRGESLLVMSERAYQSLTNEQIKQLATHARLVHSPLTTIENNGGGSARCMMAEIFLPEKK